MAQTLQVPWELLPAMCCLFEGTHRKRALLGSLSVHVEEHSLLGARRSRQGLDYGEEDLGFCVGFLVGTCVVSTPAFDV